MIGKFLLPLGLNFGVPFFEFSKRDILLHFEQLIYTLQNQPLCGNHGMDEAINGLRVDTGKLPQPFRYIFNLVSLHDVNIFKKLKRNKEVIECKPEKGNGCVLLNRNDYDNNKNTILSDRTKFKVCDEDFYKLNLNTEDKIN